MLMNMVKGLQATVTKLQNNQADRRAPRSWDDPVRPSQLTCWRCGMPGMKGDTARKARGL